MGKLNTVITPQGMIVPVSSEQAEDVARKMLDEAEILAAVLKDGKGYVSVQLYGDDHGLILNALRLAKKNLEKAMRLR